MSLPSQTLCSETPRLEDVGTGRFQAPGLELTPGQCMALGQTFATDYNTAGSLDSNMVLGFSSWAPAQLLSRWGSVS